MANFNVAIFSDSLGMINVTLSSMVVLIELHPFTSLSVILIDCSVITVSTENCMVLSD